MSTAAKASHIEGAVEAAGGEDLIFRRISDGESITQVARSLVVSRSVLSAHLNRDDAHRQRLLDARDGAADALGDQILDIADTATPQNNRVAKLRIDARRLVAARLSPDAWGEKSGPVIQINANDLHLQALRKIRAEDQNAKLLPSASTGD